MVVHVTLENPNSADSHLFKVDNQNTKIIWQVCLKLTIKHQNRVMCLLWTLNRFHKLFRFHYANSKFWSWRNKYVTGTLFCWSWRKIMTGYAWINNFFQVILISKRSNQRKLYSMKIWRYQSSYQFTVSRIDLKNETPTSEQVFYGKIESISFHQKQEVKIQV